MANPFTDRLNKNRLGKAGRTSENRLAKKLKGRQTIGSGNKDWDKGDIRRGEFLIEAKSTTNDAFKIEYAQLCKIVAESTTKAKIPALSVSFVTENGRPRKYGEYALIRLSDFEEFMQYRESLGD